jgi:glycosyltransferase involved in cell wall biosynthesis
MRGVHYNSLMGSNKRHRGERDGPSHWDLLQSGGVTTCHGDNCPAMTVVIASHNASHHIATTLQSLVDQNYVNLEVLVIDASSTDPTTRIIKSFTSLEVTVHTVDEYRVYEMFNRGISLAHGEYINFLKPGDYYLPHDTFQFIGGLIQENHYPDLVYGGTLIRRWRDEPEVLLRDLSLSLLKRGQLPTTLQSCWWRRETLRALGKFDSSYQLQGNLDLMCRFALRGGLHAHKTTRVLTDADRRGMTQWMLFRHFTETIPILFQHFSFWQAMKWWYEQPDLSRSFRLWLRGLRIAFLGRN